MKVWLAPNQYERRYKRFLGKTARQVREEFLRRLSHIIRHRNLSFEEQFMDRFYVSAQRSISDDSDEIAILLGSLSLWWLSQKPNVTVTIRGLFNAIGIFNDNQFRLVIRDIAKVDISSSSRLGFATGQLLTPTQEIIAKFGESADVYRQEPYLDGTQKNWEATQEEYIDKTMSGAVTDAGLIVRNGLATGAKAAVVLAAVDKLFDAVINRTNRFTEDQVNSLNTQLSKLRQQSFGSDKYEWETMRDERVRGNPNGLYPKAKPSHYHRDGQIFSWNKPPEGGHPSEDYGCRCKARMILPK